MVRSSVGEVLIMRVKLRLRDGVHVARRVETLERLNTGGKWGAEATWTKSTCEVELIEA